MLDGDAVTLIAWQNGLPVLKNGLVATEQACCCGKCACGGCNAAVRLVVDGLDADSFCLEGTYYGSGNGIEPGPGGCNSCEECEPHNSHGGNTAIMVCEADPASQRGIRYRVTATNIFEYSAFLGCVKSCTVVWEGFVEADEQCLPVAGSVTLTEISRENINGGCSYLQPITVSVERA